MPKIKDGAKKPEPLEDDPLLSTKEVAELLNVSWRTVEDWRLDRKLPVVKVGRLNRFRRSAVIAFIQEDS